MKDNIINKTHIEGYLYQHSLDKKIAGPNSAHPGVEFITGTIEIATDNAMLNVVPVHYTYVTAKTSAGKDDARYEALSNIINGTYKSVMADGADKATKLRIDSAIGLNEFYSDRNGTEELVSAKRNEGGFIHVTNALNENEGLRNTFEVDMIITNVSRKEADDERNLPEKGIVKGYIFDFRKALLPTEFSVLNPKAIEYFEGLDASEKNPTFTKVWGNQISESVKRTITIEGAFGDEVREVTGSHKDFVIINTNKEVYLWDDESTITNSEFNKFKEDRAVTVAGIKQRQDEYKASKAGAAVAAPAAGGFNF